MIIHVLSFKARLTKIVAILELYSTIRRLPNYQTITCTSKSIIGAAIDLTEVVSGILPSNQGICIVIKIFNTITIRFAIKVTSIKAPISFTLVFYGNEGA